MAAPEKKAEAEGAHLVFADESGFFLNPTVRRSWAPKGETPVLTGWGRHRGKVSTAAAVSVSPVAKRLGLYFATDPGRYLDNAGVAAFLRALLRHLRGRVILVWDRGSNHKGPPIRDLLARHPRLSVEWLPAYAPDLNPVEAVWGYLKHGKMANFVPEGVAHLDDAVTEHLSDARHDPVLLDGLWRASELPHPADGS